MEPLRNRRKPPAAPDALAFSLRDATRMSGMSEITLRRHAKEGRLELIRVGGMVLVNGDSLRKLLGIGI